MKEIATNELNSPEKPGDGWYIIEAAGRHPHGELMQNLTPAVLARVAAAGVPPEGLPVDKDHLSYQEDKTTEAMGWVRELAMCGGDLAARIEWTPPGLALVQGKVYKHFSTVYPAAADGAMEYEPERLIGLALTNQPNNREGQPPITNSAALRGADDEVDPAGGFTLRDVREYEQKGLLPRHGAEAKNQTNTENKTMNPTILAKLGLAEGATDEEIIAAIEGLQAQVAAAENAAADAAAAEAESIINAEEAAADVKLEDEERKEVAEEIIDNRAHGLKFLRLLVNSKRPTATPAPRRYADNSTPEARAALANRTPQKVDEKQAILNRANEICREAKARGQHKSFTAAKRDAELEFSRKH